MQVNGPECRDRETVSIIVYNKLYINSHNGPFPGNIRELRSPRQPRSKARIRSIGYDADDKICTRARHFGHPSLAFDLVTHRS